MWLLANYLLYRLQKILHNGRCLRMFKVLGRISLNQQINDKKTDWQNDKEIR